MQTDGCVSCAKADLLKSSGTFCVLVGVTGSVAALKLPILVSQLLELPRVSSIMHIRCIRDLILETRSFFVSALFL